MKVTFQIVGGSPVSIECNAGDNLLELARRANVAIDAPCSGNGSCGKCKVKLLEGETCAVMAATREKIIELLKNDEFVPYEYIEDFLKSQKEA